MLEAKKKRFWENWIGIKIYAANKRSSVSEIAWYYTEEGRRIGIGYVVKTRLLWIWDYDISDYVAEEKMSENSKQILKEFKDTIYQL